MALSLIAQTPKKIDAKKGFKHFIFGKGKSAFNLNPTGEDDYYVLHSSADTLTVGGVRLKNDAVVFRNDKLTQVAFRVSYMEHEVLKALITAYGPPITTKESDGNKYVWSGKFMHVTYHINKSEGLLIFTDAIYRAANIKLKKDSEKRISNKIADDL